jgi:hypothetical protein
MDLKHTGYKDVNWIKMAHDRVLWLYFLKTEMNLWVRKGRKYWYPTARTSRLGIYYGIYVNKT